MRYRNRQEEETSEEEYGPSLSEINRDDGMFQTLNILSENTFQQQRLREREIFDPFNLQSKLAPAKQQPLAPDDQIEEQTVSEKSKRIDTNPDFPYDFLNREPEIKQTFRPDDHAKHSLRFLEIDQTILQTESLVDNTKENIIEHQNFKPPQKKLKRAKSISIEQKIENKKQKFYIRKNQFDYTAAVVYGLNVSLVHITLFFMITVFIDFPDIQKAEIFDKEFEEYYELQQVDFHTKLNITPSYIDDYFESMTCKQKAIDMREWLQMFIVVHAMCVVANVYREIFETKLGVVGRIMRMVEVVALGSYNLGIIMGLGNIAVFYYWENLKNLYPDHIHDMRQCFVDNEKKHEWSGSATNFSFIEVLIYFSFTTTMVLLLIKSRCKKTGVDNSYQFESVYMSYLVNKIVRQLLYKNQKTIDLNKFQERHYIEKERTVEIEGVKLKIKLSAEDYYEICRKIHEKEKEIFVEEAESIQWLERCIVGDIKKIHLDEQRQRETNSLDQMQNTNFVYHPESLIEMQILCSIFIYGQTNMLRFYEEDKTFGDFFRIGSADFIQLALFVEHIISYLCAYYREYDIKTNGKIDINGVKRAPTESFIGSIQFFIGCLIIGFTINHYLGDANQKSFHEDDHVLLNYWIIIDLVILFLGQSYISTCLYMKTSGEVIKNLYSLYFLQQNILKRQMIQQIIEEKVDEKIDEMMQDKTKAKIRKNLGQFLVQKQESEPHFESIDKEGGNRSSSSSDDDSQMTKQSWEEEQDSIISDEIDQWQIASAKVQELYDQKLKIKLAEAETQIIEIEDDYLHCELMKIPNDVYNLTIAANLSNDCSPDSLIFCIKQCIFVFLIQTFIAFMFCREYQDVQNIQPFSTFRTFLRLIATVLLTMKYQADLYNSTKMLCYLKRVKHAKGRFINVILCSMQLIVPIFSVMALMINITQQDSLSQITKAYMTLSFITTIDDMFASSLPAEIRRNAAKLNSRKNLKITCDYNTFGQIFMRIKECKDKKSFIYELANLVVNVWCGLLINFQLIFFNYFGGVACILFQILGFYLNMYKII